MSSVSEWFQNFDYPSPVGLSYGIAGVAAGQVLVLTYYYIMCSVGGQQKVQVKEPKTAFWKDVQKHFSGVEAFVMLLAYLCITWMFRLMPDSYYNMKAPVNWVHVFLQFAVVDFFTYVNHFMEHKFRWVYGWSHKPHHQYVVPKMLDAFSGSVADTTILILIPLFITRGVCNFCSCWDYIAFGFLYSTDFMLIHHQYRNCWDDAFTFLGIGTAEDHNVHHAILSKNYGHFFMWWDMVFGTHVSPLEVKAIRRKAITGEDLKVFKKPTIGNEPATSERVKLVASLVVSTVTLYLVFVSKPTFELADILKQ